jgi:hypothetical protein
MAAAGDCGSRQCNPRLGHAPAIFGAKGVSGHAAYARAKHGPGEGHGPQHGVDKAIQQIVDLLAA